MTGIGATAIPELSKRPSFIAVEACNLSDGYSRFVADKCTDFEKAVNEVVRLEGLSSTESIVKCWSDFNDALATDTFEPGRHCSDVADVFTHRRVQWLFEAHATLDPTPDHTATLILANCGLITLPF